tara:strand:+ start:175 stop:453 length:279 start_codon:yes stop_codon:yes gene_type:complete
MADSLETFKKNMWDFWKNDLFQDCPQNALADYNQITDSDWTQLYIEHIEKQIDDLNYDLIINLHWLSPPERIELTRDLKAHKALLKTLKKKG